MASILKDISKGAFTGSISGSLVGLSHTKSLTGAAIGGSFGAIFGSLVGAFAHMTKRDFEMKRKEIKERALEEKKRIQENRQEAENLKKLNLAYIEKNIPGFSKINNILLKYNKLYNFEDFDDASPEIYYNAELADDIRNGLSEDIVVVFGTCQMGYLWINRDLEWSDGSGKRVNPKTEFLKNLRYDLKIWETISEEDGAEKAIEYLEKIEKEL